MVALLSPMIIHNIKEGEYVEDKEILRAIQKAYKIEDPVRRSKEMVTLITEDYSAWNILKKDISSEQLRLTEMAIENNPKSYQAWYHRLYIYRKDPVLVLEKIERETKLLKLLLEFDSRNFHCWNYKSFLIDILRDLIDVEGPVSDDEVRNIRNSGIKVYPCSDRERVTPHEETIRLLDQHLTNLRDVGKNVSNYSYLHFHGGFDLCAAVFTDPFDEGIWTFYHRKREDFLLSGGFYVRRYANRLEVHFKESFSGDLTVEFDSHSYICHVELPTRIFTMALQLGENVQSLQVNGKILNVPSQISRVSLHNMHTFPDVFSENIFLTDCLYKEILELEPSCHFNFIFNLNSIENTKEILEMLKSKDPLRLSYYETLEEDQHTIYI